MPDPLFRPRRPNQDGPPSSANEIKGWLAEAITQRLFASRGPRVERDVMVKTVDGGDERQVDVLIVPAGFEHVRESFYVIECKNYGEQIGIESIDAFVGKLDDLGVARGSGCYVAAKGFTSKAERRAKTAGITLLRLTGIESTKRLKPEISKALQSVVYVLADFGNVFDGYMTNDLHADVHDALIYFDDHGHWKHVLDLLWEAWSDGRILPTLGTHVIRLKPPLEWFRVIHSERHPASELSITVDVTGHIHSIEGQAQQHALFHVGSDRLHTFAGQATFSQPPGTANLQQFNTEKGLEEYIIAEGITHFVHRVRVPRLRYWSTMYWPPSERVSHVLRERMRPFALGLAPDPRPFDFFELEGTSILRGWERIAKEYLHRTEACALEGEPTVEVFWTDSPMVNAGPEQT
jgi:hypothetical protein